MLTEMKDFIDKWYGGKLPTISNFVDFSLRSVEFANYIAHVRKINVVNANTAFMDKGEIYHPAMWYFSKYYTDYLNLDQKDAIYAAISLHNGGQIHESLHVKLTPLDWSKEFTSVLDNTDYIKDHKNTKLLKFCFNIIEDIYIEHYGLKHYGNFFQYNLFLNDVYFPEDTLHGFLVTADVNKQDFINCLISWKRIQNRQHIVGEKFDKFVDVFYRTLDIGLTPDERYKLAFEMFELLVENGVTHDDVSQDGKSISEYNKLTNFLEYNDEELDEVEAEVNIKRSEMEQKKPTGKYLKVEDFTNKKWEIVKHYDLPDSKQKIKLDKRFMMFSNYIKTVRTPKPNYLLIKEKGNTILERELYRIGLDGQCLTNRTIDHHAKEKPQFVLLVDSSGSMWHRYEPTVNSAASVYMSLSSADIPVSFWCHTGYDKPEVYTVSAYKMPMRNKDVTETTFRPLDRISNALQIELEENFDGLAIEYVSSYFAQGRQKYLIVFSDGQPAGVGYGGSGGYEHTKNVIKTLRQKGINVYALSLDESVKNNNDEIYGKQYNIYAWQNLDRELKKLVGQLV